MIRPVPLWLPSPQRQRESAMWRFINDAGFDNYDDAWAWSVSPSSAADFWAFTADHLGVAWRDQPSASLVRAPEKPSGAGWFPGGTLNYAELCLADRAGDERAIGDRAAVISISQTRPDSQLTWSELRRTVDGIRSGLVDAGVSSGDCVAGYLPNVVEALASMLAVASLGAIWTCCAPEMGVDGCVERLKQVSPKLLIAIDGYRYASHSIDRRREVTAIADALPSLSRRVWVSYLHPSAEPPGGWQHWSEFSERSSAIGELEFEPVAFDHPLYVLFSSGTTGKPKGIVHGHGGIALEHAKALRLHFDVGPSDRFFWYTTTGWMMWNLLASGLIAGSTIVLYDGDPSGTDGNRLWDVMSSQKVSCGGVGASYLAGGAKAGHRPGDRYDLSRLKTLGATGSPLSGDAARWVYEAVNPDVLLSSFSGGTDVCTGFVGASPLHPVWAGEISCRCLGAKVEVFDDDGNSQVGSEGELVLTAPLPSMPVAFVDDEDGSRLRSAYFERYPGVWHHGDRAVLSERGTLTITGRSDGTLNRGGVRMGTAELYSVLDSLPEVSDSLAVHLEDPGGGPGELLVLVVGAPGADNDEVTDVIRTELRRRLSPRHVPDRVEFVTAIPRTLSGKRLEVPVKRVLLGAPPSEVLSTAALTDPSSIDPIVELARRRAGARVQDR